MGERFAVLFVGRGLLQRIAAHAGRPAVAECPAGGIIGVQFVAAFIVGVAVALVENIADFGIGHHAFGLHIRNGIHRLDGPMVGADIGQIVFIVTAGGQIGVERHNAVQLVAVVVAQRCADHNVAQAGFALAAAAGFHFQINQRHDGVQRQIAAEHFLRRDPNQARGNHVGIDAEIGHVEVVAVVVVEAAGVIVLAIHHAIHARRRQRTGHKAFHAVRVNGCAAFGGMRLCGQRQQGDGGENAGGAHGVSPRGCCVFLGGLHKWVAGRLKLNKPNVGFENPTYGFQTA